MSAGNSFSDGRSRRVRFQETERVRVGFRGKGGVGDVLVELLGD